MKKIIIDTNIWVALAERKLELFEELKRVCDFPFQVVVLEGTLRELKKIQEEQRSRFKRAAKLALDIIKAKKMEIFPHSVGDVDELLVDYSHGGFLVLTQDIALKKRLQKPYLTIRQNKYLMLVK